MLVAANDLVLATGEWEIPLGSVARHAGVSVGSASRHFVDSRSLAVEAAVHRTRSLIEGCGAVIESRHTFFDKLESALIHLIQTAASDPLIVEANRTGSDHVVADRVLQSARRAASGFFVAAQHTGHVRSDVPLDDILHWLTDEIVLMACWDDRSRDRIVRRYRTFVIPGLQPAAPTPTWMGSSAAQ
jgi:hypothetical protein